MLSTNSSSSIQKRRQQHRRQQSLEVPILATPLPAHRQRNPHQQQAHRRGLSLDQSLTTIDTAAGFRPLLPQEHPDHHPSGSPSVRIQLDTNIGPPLAQQHFVQESQQQRPLTAQPGYLPQDFQSHLQQQLNGSVDAHIDFKPVIASPQPQHPQQQRALEELQHHLAWYRDNFSSSPNPAMQNTQSIENGVQLTVGMSGAPVGVAIPLMHSVQAMPVTPISQCNARTVPNTPQTHVQSWPSPPPGGFKHARSQSFQLDVAPMPDSSINLGMNLPFTQISNSFGADSVIFSNDGGYASSAYSSSAVDPMSPGHQQQIGPMPTLFEEPPMHDGQASFGHFQGPSLLLQATAGAQDFTEQDFDFGPGALSPRQQLINNLGPDVPASIVETGVAAYEVQQYIGELNEADNKYPCLWEGCNRRFGRKENVRAHVQTHLGDRQFRCNLCDKTFVRQHDLKRHIAIHSDDRPFVCPCGTGFARHDALTRHRQRGMCTGALPGFEKSEEEKPKRGRPKKERPNLEDRTDKASKQRKKNNAKEAAGQDDDAELHFNYASSSSGASDRSFPVTPPDTSDDFNTDAFLNMAGGDIQFANVTASWRDTPPTSPPSASPVKTIDSGNPTFDFDVPVGISPAMLSNASSPPVATGAIDAHTPQSNHDIFDNTSPSDSNDAGGSFNGGSSPADDNDLFGGVETGISVQPDAINDAFSPPGESYGGSSVYNYSDNGHAGHNVFDKEYNEFTASVDMDDGMLASLMPAMRTDNERVFADMLEDWVANH
ncbi:Metallothionein expression activator [Recurvomyces mirabilis]|nr:Metallothionein expression activator [Recurvomyces mirabilis]